MKKKTALIVTTVVIAVVAILGVLYFTTDLFKTPDQLFYKYFGENLKLTEKMSYEELIFELKKQAEEPMEVEGELTLKMTSDDEENAEISQILEKGKIKYNSKTIGKEQKSKQEITLNYNNKDIVTLNILQNKEQYGIKIAELYEKYISVENNNLKAIFQKLGVDVTDIPNKIETVDYYELLNVDNKTINHITETYSNILKENIPTENYSVEKEVTIKIDETEVKTNAYKLSLTETQLKNIIVKSLESLKADDVTLNLIVDKYNKIVESYGEMIEEEKITKEVLIKEIEKTLEDLKEETVTETKMLELIVYSAKDNKTKIEILGFEDEKVTAKMQIDMIEESATKAKIISSISSEDTLMEIEVSVDNTKTDCILKIESEGTSIEVNSKQEIKDSQNVVIETFDTTNSVKINDMTQNDIGLLIQEIYTNAMLILPQKMQLLGIDMSAQI